MANLSVSSTQRLPSPPPFTENQIQTDHPTVDTEPLGSPRSAAASSAENKSTSESSTNHVKKEHGTVRRIRPGTRSIDIATGPPLIPLGELDSAFQLQEHLSALIASSTSRPSGGLGSEEHTVPLSKTDCDAISTVPEGVDERLWCYELTRRLTRDLNILVVALIRDGCTATSCPEMRADEWQYLCAAHDPPRSCCAIDYITHTLDNAAMILCSTKYFPSRLSLTGNGTKHLSSIFRRLYRIFAHAWFQHRDVFWEVEREYGLYLFFKTVSEHYGLIPEDNLTIPPEAEDIEALIAKQKESEEFRSRGNNGTRTLEDFQSWPREGGEDSDSDGEGSEFDLDEKDTVEGGDEKGEKAESEGQNGNGEAQEKTDELKDDLEELEEIPVSLVETDREEKPVEEDAVEKTAESKPAPASPPSAIDNVGDAASDEKPVQEEAKAVEEPVASTEASPKAESEETKTETTTEEKEVEAKAEDKKEDTPQTKEA